MSETIKKYLKMDNRTIKILEAIKNQNIDSVEEMMREDIRIIEGKRIKELFSNKLTQ